MLWTRHKLGGAQFVRAAGLGSIKHWFSDLFLSTEFRAIREALHKLPTCKVCYPKRRSSMVLVTSHCLHLGLYLNFSLVLGSPCILTSHHELQMGWEGWSSHRWPCWAPKPSWARWEKEWGRMRPVSLGHWRKWLQERWRCTESVEKGAARADIPDASNAPVKSRWQDFPKRKDN